MADKKITLAFLFSLVFLLAVGTVSAVSLGDEVTITNIPGEVSHKAGSFDFDLGLSNEGAEGSVTMSYAATSGNFELEFSEETFTMAAGNSTNPSVKTIEATLIFSESQSGFLRGSITADPAGSGTARTVNFEVEITDSASMVLLAIDSVTLSRNGTFRVSNTGNKDLDVDLRISSGNATLSSSNVNVGAGEQSGLITISPEFPEDIIFGPNKFTVEATETRYSLVQNLDFTLTKTFCSNGRIGGGLRITDVNINNEDGDDTEWFLYDEILVEVDVENTLSDNINDVWVEIGIFNDEGVNVIGDFEFLENTDDEEKYDLGRIRDDEEETATFRFRPEGDVDDGDYKLAVKAYSDDSKYGEDVLCVDEYADLSDRYYESIDIQREDDEGKYMKFTDIEVSPSELTCGETGTVRFKMINIGDVDQDRVRVSVYNNALGIDEIQEITSDFDQGDSKTMEFDFLIPQDATDGTVKMSIFAEYEYDDGDYEEYLDEPEQFDIKIIGCDSPISGDDFARINAALDSDAVAGQEMTVRAVLTNLGTESRTVTISAEGYDSWADLVDVSESIFVLDGRSSKEVTFTFDVDEDAAGDRTFRIEAASNGQTQISPIKVTIKESAQGSTSGWFSGIFSGDNSMIWIIGAINLVLIILIILVAVRVSRR